MKNKIGTKEKPLVLKTPPLTSEYTMHVDEKDGKEVLVCTVGKTVLHYDLRCLDDLHAMLKKTRRLDGTRKCRRTKTSKRRHSGSLGPFRKKSRQRLVWFKERTPGSVWNVYSAVDGKTWPRGGNTRSKRE